MLAVNKTATKTSAFGIYATREMAENAVDRLLAAGFGNDDISVLLQDNAGTKDFAHEKNTKAPEGATTGAGTGALLGGGLGWLVGIGALAIPGLGRSSSSRHSNRESKAVRLRRQPTATSRSETRAGKAE